MCLAPVAAAMAPEELQEADVLWPDHCSPDDGQLRQQSRCWRPGRMAYPCVDAAARGGGVVVRRPGSSSAPVAIIPVASAATWSTSERPASSSWAQDHYGHDDEAAFVPPHVALAARRRWSEGRAASSLCVGLGRTLKGRDLQSVRTAVLRMTGFIET